MDKPKPFQKLPSSRQIILIYVITLILSGWGIVQFNLPDSLLLVFMIPCLGLAFFYKRWVYLLMIAAVVVVAVGVTHRVSSSFATSLITIAVASPSSLILAEIIHALTVARGRAEQALRQREQQLNALLTSAPVVVYSADGTGGQLGAMTFVSANVRQRLGYAPQELLHAPDFWLDQVHPEDRPRILEAGRALPATDQTTLEYRFRGRDGRYRWLHDEFHRVQAPDGRTEIVGAWFDITDRKRAEASLQEKQALLDLFFAQSLDGFFFMMLDEPVRWDETMDKDQVLGYVFAHQRITQVNDAMLAQYGATREQFLGLTPQDFFAHNLAHGQAVWRDLFDAGRLHVDTDERKFDGTAMWIEGDYHCLYDAQGRITGHFGVQREVTEQRRMMRALDERERFLVTLNDITRAALETLDPPTLLQTLADRMGALFAADGCYVTLWDETIQATVPVAAYGPLRQVYPRTRSTPGELTMTESVLHAGHPLVAEDVFNSPYMSPQIAVKYPARSLLGLPLIVGERKLGAVLIAFNTPHHFTAEEVQRAEQTAGQIALAAAKTLLLEETRAHWREAETLRAAALALTSALDRDAVIDCILAQLQQVVPYNLASVQLLRQDQAGERLEIVDGHGLSPLEENAGHPSEPGQQNNLSYEVVRTRASLVVNNEPLRAPEPGRGLHALGGSYSWLGTPMLVGERLIGVIALDRTVPGFYTPEHARLAEAFAAQAAIAIENAQLYEALQAYTGQLEERVRERTAELQAQYAQLDAILRSVGDAIFVTDPHRRVHYANPAFTALTGYTAEEVLGQDVTALEMVADSGPLLHSMESSLSRGQPWQGEVTWRRKDGRGYDAALTVAPVSNSGDQGIGYVFSHRDISQSKNLERARNQFITNVSHQFRTPITTLKLNVHLLQRIALTAKQQDYLQAINMEIERLVQLIEDTLQITALDSGKGFTAWKPIALPGLVEEVVASYQERAAASGLVLEAMPLPPDLPFIKGDRVRLVQALGEIVENAIRFTPAGGRVTVTVQVIARQAENWATLVVQDTGPGIPPEEQGKVFERFYRGSLVEAGHIPGTGLGLSIAQLIAEAHGGRITLESKEGAGSTFTLWLRTASG